MTWLSIANPFFLVFWLLPPALIGLKLAGRIKVSHWAILLGYVIIGYLCVNLGIWLHYELLGWLIHTTANPPKAWLRAWEADGAKRVFGLFLGWVYALIYFIAWLVTMCAIQKLIGSLRKTKKVKPAPPPYSSPAAGSESGEA
jgi:hypothetical protein